jgi:hypothetical protein
LLGLAGIAVFGCATAYPGAPGVGELSQHLTLPEDSGRQARGQRPDEVPIQLAQAQIGPGQFGAGQIGAPQPTAPQYAQPQFAQPAAPVPQAAPALPGLPPPLPLPPTTPNATAIPTAPGGIGGLPIAPPPASGMLTASLSMSAKGRVPVRAWVNGRPIFEDEVLLAIEMTNPQLIRVRDREQFVEGFKKVLDNIIEMEVAYQEAVKKLEKTNPQSLVKLREFVDEDFQKQSKPAKAALPPEKFAEFGPVFRRQIERQLIGMEYVRYFVKGPADRLGTTDLKEYYDAHLNEFQKISTVKWQNVFLAVKPDRNINQTLQLAEGMLEQCRRGGDFMSLMKYDDGDSKTRDGKGFGARKGEIRPVELEEPLFVKMKPGDLGLQQISTGVHLFRLVERQDGGQIPFDETVQTQIRNKMKSQIMEREFKRFVRELKDRAIIEYEKGI